MKKILFVLYFSRYYSKPYVSVKGLVSKTGIPESTIKDILRNLVKNGWIEKRSCVAIPDEFSIERTIPLEKIQIKKLKGKTAVFWTPGNIVEEFEKRLAKLPKLETKKEYDKGLTIIIKPYEKKVKELDRRKKLRVLNDYSLPLHGRTRLVNSLLKKWYNKKPINFYKILVFPYIIDDRVGGYTKLSTKEMLIRRWHDIPKKHKEFWKKASEELKRNRKEVENYEF